MLNPKVRQKTLRQGSDGNWNFYLKDKKAKQKFSQINQELLNTQV